MIDKSLSSARKRKVDLHTRYLPPRHGMEWNGKWNGREISVWNMEDARMEWNGRFQELNGRQSSILSYQFHAKFRTWHLQQNIYGL